jgi:hypothetical protein
LEIDFNLHVFIKSINSAIPHDHHLPVTEEFNSLRKRLSASSSFVLDLLVTDKIQLPPGALKKKTSSFIARK